MRLTILLLFACTALLGQKQYLVYDPLTLSGKLIAGYTYGDPDVVAIYANDSSDIQVYLQNFGPEFFRDGETTLYINRDTQCLSDLVRSLSPRFKLVTGDSEGFLVAFYRERFPECPVPEFVYWVSLIDACLGTKGCCEREPCTYLMANLWQIVGFYAPETVSQVIKKDLRLPDFMVEPNTANFIKLLKKYHGE
jgi:hypothetical protein